ncbi:MAG TPA: hypothetical protein VHB68_08690 [Steroidobacteraceae bacterium]|nr:hypothetical protein [Steroidobacteraceae bacterium]
MLFLSLYTPAVKPSGPPSPEDMAKMGALIEKTQKNGTLVYTGPLGKSGPGGAKVRRVKGEVMVAEGPFSNSTLMAAAGFAILRADSREHAIEQAKEFLQVAGDGETELLQILEMPGCSAAAGDGAAVRAKA